MVKNPSAYDILGNIAIVKFPRGVNSGEKKKFGEKVLRNNKSVKTILEKVGDFSGRLRKMKTRFVVGENTKEVLYRENNCVFRFNVDSTYFSPRLSNERKEIAGKIKNGDDVLVMFAGVAPFSIGIARNSRAKKIYSNEINREANKYAKLNLELNKVKDRVELVSGDANNLVKKIGSLRSQLMASRQTSSSRSAKKSIINKNSPLINFKKSDERMRGAIPKKFDVIVMPRPQLKDSFLKTAFDLSKKGTRIYYYDFCKIEDVEKIVEKVKSEAKKSKKKIKILKVKKAGEIAPYKIRVRVDFIVR